mgnify:CR=1 FL=1
MALTLTPSARKAVGGLLAAGMASLTCRAEAPGGKAAGADTLAASLTNSFRGRLSEVSTAPQSAPIADDLDLSAMAKSALNYLRGNPDPARRYECKFCLGPLGIPSFVPDLPPTEEALDVIALGDTDCRMEWQYAHMREMAGEATPCACEAGVRQRVLSYLRPDGLAWVNPAAWIGEKSSVTGLWATTWGTGKILVTLSETYRQTRNPADLQRAKTTFEALRRLAHWDGPRAYYPGGPTPWRDGEWLRLGWAADHYHNYPSLVEPLVRYYECTGDREGLECASAFTEGFLAESQPNMEGCRINPQTGAFAGHVHTHTHAIWGVAHLGALLKEPRYLDWSRRAYDFVVANGTDYGWYPEFIGSQLTEICVVGDMTSLAGWFARSGRPEYWDHVERTIRNEIRRSQFFMTPAFLKLFRDVHKDKPPEVVDAALAELRKLEGGFVAQSTLDDWVGFPAAMGKPGRMSGIHMMGCCPPEGMRALWEAWTSAVETNGNVVQVNLCLTRNHPAAQVKAYRPECGRLDVTAKRPGDYLLRAPSWAVRSAVQVRRNGTSVDVEWGGPANAYVRCASVHSGDQLTVTWPVPVFSQTFVPLSATGGKAEITVRWIGNEVTGVEPRGKYLPMFGPSP